MTTDDDGSPRKVGYSLRVIETNGLIYPCNILLAIEQYSVLNDFLFQNYSMYFPAFQPWSGQSHPFGVGTTPSDVAPFLARDMLKILPAAVTNTMKKLRYELKG